MVKTISVETDTADFYENQLYIQYNEEYANKK